MQERYRLEVTEKWHAGCQRDEEWGFRLKLLWHSQLQGLLSAPAVQVYWINKTLFCFVPFFLALRAQNYNYMKQYLYVYADINRYHTHYYIYVCIYMLRVLYCFCSWFYKCSYLYYLMLPWNMLFCYPWNTIHLLLTNKVLEISLSFSQSLHSSGKPWQP